MGNLGRVGYGGTLDGMWPYSYDECDAGSAAIFTSLSLIPNLTDGVVFIRLALPNQTNPNTGLPEIAKTSGTDKAFDYALSYLPGQRLSRCTCPKYVSRLPSVPNASLTHTRDAL